MRAIAASLSEQDIADLAAFYEKHIGDAPPSALPDGAPAAPDAVAQLLTKGACTSCHGANYSKPIDGTYPKIAGQFADYMVVALKSYQVEGNAQVGRNNAIMAGVAKQFSLAELKAMAEYLSTLPGELRTVKDPYFH
jgi:cytochrome c553